MELIEKSFKEMYPEKEFNFQACLNYNDKFKPFNANIRMRRNNITLNLSRKWEHVSEEIQIGLIQSLLMKLFKEGSKTTNTELYNIFMKKIHIAAPKTESDPALEESFNRVNEKYFYGLMEKPNLKWGSLSLRELGSYEYGSDTVTLSAVLKDETFLMDYIMYHELLHKKHKFQTSGFRSYHHTKKFQNDEAEFENKNMAESMIRQIIKRYSRKKAITRFFGF